MKNNFFWFIIVLLNACNVFIGAKNLGSGYYFDTDQIVYTEKKKYDGIGFSVIPSQVLSIGSNDNFILASSKNKFGVTKYWIISKKAEKKEIKYVDDNEEISGYYIYSNIEGPLNETAFKEVRKKYHVPEDLELKAVN